MRSAALVAGAFALAIAAACGGDVASPACESRASEGACADESRCVWLSPAPKGCRSEWNGLHSACFDRTRIGDDAVCGADEDRQRFWGGCSVDDELDLGIPVCVARR